MSDPSGTPLRLCVDQFLPARLHQAAGRLSSQERPGDSVLMEPETWLPADVFHNADFTPADRSALIFQRVGLLRQAKWEPGRTIAIGFYPDAPAGMTSRIMAILEESSAVINLHWRQVPVNQAEYRVAFQRGNGLWSMIGTQSLMIPDQPTCNLGDVNWADPRDILRCVRHEIVGHGIGALHAQSLGSYAEIVDLDLPGIIAYYQQSQGWSYAQAKAQFDRVADAEVEQGLQSRTSIMAYEIDPRFDRRGIGVPFNWDWDETDRAQFRLSYPQAEATGPPPEAEDEPPPSQQEDVPLLKWAEAYIRPYRAGSVARMKLRTDRPAQLNLWVMDLADGTPVIDLVGLTTTRLSPRSGVSSNVVRFSGSLSGPGVYELLLRFVGQAPSQFKITAKRV